MLHPARSSPQSILRTLGSLLPTRWRRPVRGRIIRPRREDAQRTYPTVGLTPSRLRSFLQAADAGTPQVLFELFGDMLQSWPRLAAVEATRRLALTALDWEIVPDTDAGADAATRDAAQRAAEHCR